MIPFLLPKFNETEITLLCLRTKTWHLLLFATKVMVHTPEDFPDVTTAYKVHTAIDRTSRISVSVSQVLADDSLYRLNEQNRKCFMHRPRSIFDKGESASSSSRIKNDEDTCHSKCRIQTIHKKCNCTPYYFDVYKGGLFLSLWHL